MIFYLKRVVKSRYLLCHQNFPSNVFQTKLMPVTLLLDATACLDIKRRGSVATRQAHKKTLQRVNIIIYTSKLNERPLPDLLSDCT
jgi:hypothetical protein